MRTAPCALAGVGLREYDDFIIYLVCIERMQDDDDDVYYFIGERVKLERETEKTGD